VLAMEMSAAKNLARFSIVPVRN